MSTISRRDMIRCGAIMGTGVATATLAVQCSQTSTGKGDRAMKAGFARVKITPPVGTAMTGFGPRDVDPGGCRG